MCRSAGAPPDNTTSIGVYHEGHIDKARPGADIGEVGDPECVGPWRMELPVDVIQWARRGLIGNRRPDCLATYNAVQAHATHQPFHRVPRDGDALPLHLEPHFAGTIDLVVPLEDAADRWPQGRIPTHSCR